MPDTATAADKPGRPNQRRRTRKDLLQAAARLMKQGRSPSLEEIAAEALVSRATAYRYFPSVEALLLEAGIDVAVPAPAELFPPGDTAGAVERVQRVDTALHEVILANEPALRMMLVHTLQRPLRAATGSATDATTGSATGAGPGAGAGAGDDTGSGDGTADGIDLPARQNRRTPLLEAALAPARADFPPATLDTLTKTLALIVGTEAMVVLKDVLQLPDAEARAVKRWAIGALIDAARKPS